jgi:hypothetical protein
MRVTCEGGRGNVCEKWGEWGAKSPSFLPRAQSLPRSLYHQPSTSPPTPSKPPCSLLKGQGP